MSRDELIAGATGVALFILIALYWGKPFDTKTVYRTVCAHSMYNTETCSEWKPAKPVKFMVWKDTQTVVSRVGRGEDTFIRRYSDCAVWSGDTWSCAEEFMLDGERKKNKSVRDHSLIAWLIISIQYYLT
jgi:hypothetical protein